MMEPYFNQMTAAGQQAIVAEIEALKAERPRRIKILQAARALGDLSENADYSAAKRDLRHLESRLRFLNKQLQFAKVVTPTASDQAEIGNYVLLEFLDDHEQVTYQLVGKQEADIGQQKLSFASPLGQALLKQIPGTIVQVTAPNGAYQVKLLNVSLTPL